MLFSEPPLHDLDPGVLTLARLLEIFSRPLAYLVLAAAGKGVGPHSNVSLFFFLEPSSPLPKIRT